MPKTGWMSYQVLSGWLDALARETTLIAPRWVDGILLYRHVGQSQEIAWQQPASSSLQTAPGLASRPVLSVKEAFFPPSEPLMSFEKIDQEIRLVEKLPEGDQVIFGVRPCDAQGVKCLDALFLEDEPRDPYYARRRAATTLIGVACPEPGPTCFCTSMGGGPDDPRNMDILLTAEGDGYKVLVVTDQGELSLEPVLQYMEPLEILVDEQLWDPAQEEPLGVQIPGVDKWPPLFADKTWDQVADRCLSCRICAYVCPACRCFIIHDEAPLSGNGSGKMERIRCWDSCTGLNYRQIAGGHNPRSEKSQRLRNRFFCKFYYYPQQYGPVACTGCGRCIDSCPAGVDVTEVLEELSRR